MWRMALKCTATPTASSTFVFHKGAAAGLLHHSNKFSSRMMKLVAKGDAQTMATEDVVGKQSNNLNKCIVAGCGAISVDYLASVAQFPQPDEKIRSVDFKIQGGGNAGNCLTALARLGLRPRILSKVAEDAFGQILIDELNSDGVDTSFIVVSKVGTTSFTYVIVDRNMNTRTCINSPGYPPLNPQELPLGALAQILDGVCVLYLDGRLPDTALLLAKEAKRKGIPILLDAERKREGLDDLLVLVDYVVCSAKFPQDWTEASTLPDALVQMVIRCPHLKFVIVTLGADGCLMFEKGFDDGSVLQTQDSNAVYELLLKERSGKNSHEPFSITSKVGLFQQGTGNGVSIKEVAGRFLMGTAEMIPSSELVDTTGSGDAFIGAVLYALCMGMQSEKMLPFAATVAGANCRALGARTGLPYSYDPRLHHFLGLPAD